nr:zinc finger protein 236 [Hymenolepis microstoma]
MHPNSHNFDHHPGNAHISIPKDPPDDAFAYSVENFGSINEPMGYTCNAVGNFRQNEYQTYRVIDPDSCQVLKEIVYINSTPQEVNVAGLPKESWLTDNLYGVSYSQQGFPNGPAALYIPPSDFNCPHCEEIFGCECRLYLHKLLHHSSLSTFEVLKCEICGKSCSRISAFKSHLSLHILRNDQRCPRCQAKLPNSSSQDDVASKVVPISSNQYRCKLCGTVNSSLTQLRIHYKRNHPKRESSATAIQQQNAQKEPSHSTSTRRISKDKAFDFIKEIASSSKYEKHKPSACNLISDIDLSEYIRKVAVTKKRHNFLCTVCGKKFPSTTRAKYHVFSHLGVKPFCCPHCSKRFTQKSAVETHMKIHDKPKSCSCPFCEKSFNFKQNLDFHVAKYHKVVPTVDKPLQTRRELSTTRSFIISYKDLSKSLLSMFDLFLSFYPLFTGRRLPCRYCFMTFSSFSVRIVHEITVHFKRSRYPRRPLRVSAVYRRHREKFAHISKLLSSQSLSHCPWCSLPMTSPKFHFVSHFLADALICGKCDRHFVVGCLCLLHMRRKHRKVKSELRLLIRCDIPPSVQQRIGLMKWKNVEANPIISNSATPFDIINLSEQSQGSTFTERGGQEIVWLTEPQPEISQTAPPLNSVVIISPEVEQIPDSQQPVDQSFVLDQGFQSGDMYLYPQDNLVTCYSEDVGYVDNATSGFDADYQPTLDFIPSSLDFNPGKVTIATDLQLPFQALEGGVSDFFGCSQCAARFDCSTALSNHATTHQISARYYNVCCNCGWCRVDSGDNELCQACGHDTFQQLEGLMEGGGLIGFPRFYCTHCNVPFTDLGQLESHVAELYTCQPQSIIEEFATVETIQPPSPPRNPPSQTPVSEIISHRQPSLPKKQHFQLSEEELDRILQTQPTSECSLSERLLYEAACERNFRSYPTTGKQTASSSSSSIDRPHVCTLCSYRFQRSSDLHRHMLLHTGVRPYACKFCDKRFILPRRLLAHATNHHGNEGAVWATTFLSGRPRSRKLLSTSPSPESLNCHLCGTKLSNAASLHAHMRIHTGTKTYACPCCNVCFRTPIQRKRHLKVCQKSQQTDLDTVTGAETFDFTPFLLDLQQPPQSSGPTSGFKDLLVTDQPSQQKHARLESERGVSSSGFVSLWQCRNCQETFNSNKAFISHQCVILHQLDSGGTRGGTVERSPFTCSICKHRFTRRSDLKRHEQTHATNDLQRRPFCCGVCGTRFTQSGSLNIHLQATGHDETSIARRRFRCRLCRSSFFYRSGLIRHSAIAHGVRSNEENTGE